MTQSRNIISKRDFLKGAAGVSLVATGTAQGNSHGHADVPSNQIQEFHNLTPEAKSIFAKGIAQDGITIVESKFPSDLRKKAVY